jgi:acyl carrier protein
MQELPQPYAREYFALQHVGSHLQQSVFGIQLLVKSCPFADSAGASGTEPWMNADPLRALIADHLAVDVSSVRDDASFVDDLGADSLDVIELAMRFEEALNIPIDDHETESCATVRDALDLVESKLMMQAA